MKAIPQLSIVSTALTIAMLACKGSAEQANTTASTDSVSAAERHTEPGRSEHQTSRTETPQSTGTHVEKNGGRDAAVGAGAGAIVGAVTSKDKLKGAVIGGAAGGILGGVVGNNVDKKTVPNSP
jgi:hypothetical protein